MKKDKTDDIQQMKELKKIVSEYLSHWDFQDELEKSMICHKYVEQFGVKDIQAFIQFCKDNKREEIITQTIAHDLNGTFHNLFLPRTSGYHKRTQKGA